MYHSNMKNDAIGNRMKTYYEMRSRFYLSRRTPVIMRLDGKSFHTFTHGFKKPFDELFADAMHQTMKYLCENIQGCVLGYTQSDEITLVLVDYKTLESDAWFDYETQKMCSIAAAMASVKFNEVFRKNVSASLDERYKTSANKLAVFDCRAFNVPVEEVTNCVLWRQLDAIRNSILSCAQSFYSQKELNGKNTKLLKEMMISEKNFDWETLEKRYKYGVCCVKRDTGWHIDYEIPVFKEAGRNYIEKRINFVEEKPSGSFENLKTTPEGRLITCGVVVRDKNGFFLACRPTGSFRLIDLPKGCSNVGERDIDTAIRECKEETGLDLSSMKDSFVDLGVHQYLKHKDMHLFLVDVDSIPIDSLYCDSTFIDKDGISKKEVSDYFLVAKINGEYDDRFIPALKRILENCNV